MTNPNLESAARVIAAAIVHGTSTDIAREVAQALDDARLLVRPDLDPFTTPGRNRPEKSPAAVAALQQCRHAKEVADMARGEVSEMPGEATVDAAGGEVTFVVHPHSLADWRTWTRLFGIDDVRSVKHTGTSAIARCRYRGVPTRLVGVGVPAMVLAELSASVGVRS
jgi:hypothetical protein